jgi:hypothetical protein
LDAPGSQAWNVERSLAEERRKSARLRATLFDWRKAKTEILYQETMTP